LKTSTIKEEEARDSGKWQHHLENAGEVALAVKIKADIETDLAKLKSSWKSPRSPRLRLVRSSQA